MELAIIILAILVLAGLLAGDTYLQRGHVARVAADWTRAGRAIQVAPVGVICHGDRPASERSKRVFGALGAVDGALVFLGHRSHIYDFTVPLAALRWIGLRTQVRHSGHRVLTSRELVIHVDQPGGWRVYTFTDGKPLLYAPRFAEAAGLPLHDIGTGYEDFGPAPAAYLVQDELGHWQQRSDDAPEPEFLPPDWDGAHNALYLAPDRLLFEWRNPIRLDQIQQVDALTGEASPFDEDLLTVGYTADGARHVAGFLVREADAWAAVIREGITQQEPA
jgi:hypothetical protein